MTYTVIQFWTGGGGGCLTKRTRNSNWKPNEMGKSGAWDFCVILCSTDDMNPAPLYKTKMAASSQHSLILMHLSAQPLGRPITSLMNSSGSSFKESVSVRYIEQRRSELIYFSPA